MLPIRRVVLYKHGVGYFQREGEVEGDAVVELHFRADEMNDVLKSLTTIDLDGGVVTSLGYEAQRSVDEQLRDVAVGLPPVDVLTGLLGELKGAELEVLAGARAVRGALVGVERLPRAEGQAVVSAPHAVLLVAGAGLESFDLRDVRALRLLDETLQRDLAHLLGVLAGSKRKDRKRLSIVARGAGRRRLVAGYLLEAPVWKTSYRILLEKDERPLVQGWAIVDNTQEEDWEEVSLTLTAGLPVSFVHDLYTPRHQKRPVVEVRREAAYAPPQVEAGMSPAAAEADLSMDVEEPLAALAAPAPRAAAAPAPRPSMKAAAVARTAAVATRTAEAADLFEYEVRHPVTVRRHQSALVPILQERFDGRRVVLYNPEVRERNPMSAVELENSTGLTLEGGPVTVFEDGRYVGEAMLDTMKAGEERFLPFSVDLGVVVVRETDERQDRVHRFLIVDGAVQWQQWTVRRSVYLVDNRGQRPAVMLLDHRPAWGHELVDTPEPAERTESFHRFRVELPAGRTTRFAVSERRLQEQRLEMHQVDAARIASFVDARWLDEAAAAALRALRGTLEQAWALGREAQALDAEVARTVKDQDRLRQNLAALGSRPEEAALRERYVGKLASDEDRLAQAQRTLDELRARKAALDAQAAAAAQALRYDRTVS
jgi:hypothetical protein